MAKGDEAILDFSRTFDSPAGERVLKQLQRITDARCQAHGVPSVAPLCPQKLAHSEGMRSVYWYIVAMIERGRQIINERSRALTQTETSDGPSQSG